MLLAYAVVHVGLRLALSSALTIDDSREAVFAQTLAWGYQARQPPLYNWLVWAAMQVFGVGVFALTALKYAVLVLAGLVVYASGRRVLPHPRLAALATFALVLMIPLSWVVHEALTHSVAVLAAAAAAFYALLRVEASGSPRAYAALGLALALGFLAKFSFVLFAGALLLASLTVDRFRARLLHPRALWTAVTLALLLLPSALWLHQHDVSLVRLYHEEVDPGRPEPWLTGLVSAVYYMARVTVYYLAPFALVFLALFRRASRAKRPGAAEDPAHRLLGRFFLAELAILLAAALFGGLTYLKFRWLVAAYVLFPLYVFSRVDTEAAGERPLRQFAAILLAAGAVLALAFVVNVVRGDRLGRASPLNTPWDRVVADVEAAGFTHGTIAGDEGPVAGNLRLRFPRARIVRVGSPEYLPPTTGGGQCLIVWERGQADAVPGEMRQWLAAALGVTLAPDAPVHAVEARYHFARRQRLHVRYILLPEGAGQCR